MNRHPYVPAIQRIDDLPHFLNAAAEMDLPALVAGRTGIGKTALLHKAASASNTGVLTVSAAPAAYGLRPDEVRAGLARELKRSIESGLPLHDQPATNRPFLALEDWRVGANPEIDRVIPEILDARRLLDVMIPEAFRIVVLATLPRDGDQVMNIALFRAARSGSVLQGHFEVDSVRFFDHALVDDFHPLVLAYIHLNPNRLQQDPSSPRAWEATSRLLRRAPENAIRDDGFGIILSGLIGDEIAREFLAFARDRFMKEHLMTVRETLYRIDAIRDVSGVLNAWNWISATDFGGDTGHEAARAKNYWKQRLLRKFESRLGRQELNLFLQNVELDGLAG